MNSKKRQLIIKGIEEYTGKKVNKLKTYADPKVSGTYALRADIEALGTIDFLIVGHFVEEWTPVGISEQLEECEFEKWPPKSGEPQFVW